jgi:hypothetical protein
MSPIAKYLARGFRNQRSADWQSAVSRIGNPQAPLVPNARPTASRQYSRLPTCATVHRTAFVCFLYLVVSSLAFASDFSVLKPAAFAHHLERFNALEDENVTNFVANAQSWDWLQRNIPFFECPDREVEEIYYFRWWSFRKHVVQTTNGFVITEFLTPVKHAGVFNTISCAAGFHLAEGRWLRDPQYLDDYIRFWLRGNGGKPQPHFHKFSSWFAAAVYDRCLVNGDKKFLPGRLDDLVADYRVWEQERQLTNGLFWQYDVRDGMEESISGSRTNRNIRPTINSYMFGNATAIAAVARLAGKNKLAAEFDGKAAQLKKLVLEKLWNPDAKFFEVLRDDGSFAKVREETGFVPWMFALPDAGKGYETAWAQLADLQGFRSVYGITTAERRSPQFRSHGYGTCEWDGAVWPFATSQTLYALANVLRDYTDSINVPEATSLSSPKGGEGRREEARSVRFPSPRLGEARETGFNRSLQATYFDAFLAYVHSQHADGKPYIGEYLDETTGQWINGRGGRSRYYNHSTFADLLITGVVGLRPRADDRVEVQPLLPDGVWDWFCLDGVKYHGHTLAIIWDRDGKHYGRGTGLIVLADGKEIARGNQLQKLYGKLPR